MAKIYLAQKFFTFKDGFSVYNESGQVVYNIKTPLISMTTQLDVDDASGKKVGEIRQSLNPLFPGYVLFANGKELGRLYNSFSLLGHKMHIDHLDWTVEGNFIGWSYTVKHGFSKIGTISQQLWHMTDHYSIEYSNPADELPLLLVALGVFLMNQDEERKAEQQKAKKN